MPVLPPFSWWTNLNFMEFIYADTYMYLTKSTVKGRSNLWGLFPSSFPSSGSFCAFSACLQKSTFIIA